MFKLRASGAARSLKIQLPSASASSFTQMPSHRTNNVKVFTEIDNSECCSHIGVGHLQGFSPYVDLDWVVYGADQVLSLS